MGHAQAAAGVAGMIKMVQSMRHEVLPATLHVDAPTPHVDWSMGSVALLTEPQPWPANGAPRRAGVSSFGISGTNAHVIIESAPPASDRRGSPGSAARRHAVGALRQVARGAGRLRPRGWPNSSARATNWTLSTSAGRWPAARPSSTRGRRWAPTGTAARRSGGAGRRRAGCIGIRGGQPSGKTVFVFPGQGAQLLGMGIGLHAEYPVFAEAFDAVITELDRHLLRPIRDVMWGTTRTCWTQRSSLSRRCSPSRSRCSGCCESWGVRPDYVLGHSIGELTAAHVAGVLSLENAALLVAARGRLMQALPEGGAMVAV